MDTLVGKSKNFIFKIFNKGEGNPKGETGCNGSKYYAKEMPFFAFVTVFTIFISTLTFLLHSDIMPSM